MNVGEKIKSARLKKNLTQKQLGELCGMADSAIRRYELGGANPKIETLRRIASALGVGLEEFMTDSELSLFESMANLYLKSDSEIQELEPLDKHTSQENYLIIRFRELNDKGRDKVVDYADDLAKTTEYTKKKEK
ncbi:MAG: helix-turn-helix transcriptional regulator [Hungatella hathewayi]|nr:helix-turn-helix transcriptional regulator [Hungatella hathewayi]